MIVIFRLSLLRCLTEWAFTTLSDRMDNKVVRTGAGQPNYWPKTWFGADAYKAKLATPKYAIKLLELVGNSFCSHPEPLSSYVRVRVWNNQGSKIQFCRDKWILDTDYVHGNLSDMPIVFFYVITPQPRLFDMLGVDGWGRRHFIGSQNRECGLKKLFWTSCHTSTPPFLDEGAP